MSMVDTRICDPIFVSNVPLGPNKGYIHITLIEDDIVERLAFLDIQGEIFYDLKFLVVTEQTKSSRQIEFVCIMELTFFAHFWIMEHKKDGLSSYFATFSF